MYTRASETNITQRSFLARGKGAPRPLPASAVGDGRELLGQAAAEGRHESEEA